MDSFTALADPNRRRMLEMLSRGPRAAGEITAEFAISAPAVSQHLKTLREAGLVHVEVRGQRRIYSLDPDGLAGFERWAREVRTFWKGHLDDLERELKTDTPGGNEHG